MNLARTLGLAATAALMATPGRAADDDLAIRQAQREGLAGRVEIGDRRQGNPAQRPAADRVGAGESLVATAPEAAELPTLAVSEQERQVDAPKGLSAGASLTAVVQKVGAGGTASGMAESRGNYRGDASVSLSGRALGESDGKVFAHLRFGQGTGIALRPTYTSTVNTTVFRIADGTDDAFAILAQAWYQLTVPLSRERVEANSGEHLSFTAGKIDPFVFFDQNAVADDESTKFLNNAFVHSPLLDSGGDVRADAHGFAPGAILQYGNTGEKGSAWGLSLGIFGSWPRANVSNSLTGAFAIAQAQAAVQSADLPGNYRAYLWRNGRNAGYDGGERRHSGFGLSADQKVADDLTLFARYAHQLTGQVRFDRAVTLGAELSGARWGRAADSLGVAFGALRTSDSFRNDSPTLDANRDGIADFGYRASGWETLAELYYRFRVTSRLELSPDFQLLRRSAGDGTAGTFTALGLRARIEF